MPASRTIHMGDAGTRLVRPLCGAEAMSRDVWGLASTRPIRVYVERSNVTVGVAAMHQLRSSGVELDPCPECLKRAQAISERLERQEVSGE